MDVLVVESPAKAKTIGKYLGPGFTVLASYGHVRDLPAKDGSVRPDEDFAMDWEVELLVTEAHRRHRQGRHQGRQALSRDRPGSRGRGDLLACARHPGAQEGAEGRRRQAGHVQRHHQAIGARRGRPSARPRPAADRRLPRPPRPGLSGRLHPVAGPVAQAAGQPLCRPRAVGGAAPDLRARGRDRGLQEPRVLDGRCRSSAPPSTSRSRPA